MAESIPTSVEQLLIASSVGRGPFKLPCKGCSTTNLTLSGEQTVDGVACVENDRVLASAQTEPKKNGIWIVKTTAWVRASDHDSDRDMVLGARVEVMNGTNKGVWHMTAPTTGTVTPDVTPTTWTLETGQLQGPIVNVGTEPSNIEVNVGNTITSDITIDGGIVKVFGTSGISLGNGDGDQLDITATSGSVSLNAGSASLGINADNLGFGEFSGNANITVGAGVGSGAIIRLQGQEIQLVADDIFTIANGTDVSVEGNFTTNRLNLVTPDTIAIAAASTKIGGTSDNDKISIAGNGSIVTVDANVGTVVNFRTNSFGIYEAAQTVPSFTFASDADAASSLTLGSGTTVTIGQTQSISGAGRTLTIAGQQGVAGQVGANLHLKSGLGGTGGTNLAGNVIVGVGQPVSNATGFFRIQREDAANLMSVRQTNATDVTVQFGASNSHGGTLIGSYLNLESSNSHVACTSATVLYLGHGGGQSIMHRESGVLVLTETLDADGATRFRFADGPTSITFDQTQKASGVGSSWTIKTQQGSSGNLGGNLILDLTAAVSNVSPELRINSDTTQLLTVKQPSAGLTALDFGATTGSTAGIIRGTTVNIEAPTQLTFQTGSGGNLYSIGGSVITRLSSATSGRRLENGSAVVYGHERINSVTTSNATPATALTFATTSNRTYRVIAYVTASNDTDDHAILPAPKDAGFRNIAGTLTQIGTATAFGSTYTDAGSAAAVFDVSKNATDIVVTVTGIAAKTINWNVVLYVFERVLA